MVLRLGGSCIRSQASDQLPGQNDFPLMYSDTDHGKGYYEEDGILVLSCMKCVENPLTRFQLSKGKGPTWGTDENAHITGRKPDHRQALIPRKLQAYRTSAASAGYPETS